MVAAAAKKVHLEMSLWWLTPTGTRVLGRPSSARVRQGGLRKSKVLHVGQIVLDMMFSDSTTMAWLPPGKDRVLTFVWATAFFGGDTVPTIAGFTPKALALRLRGPFQRVVTHRTCLARPRSLTRK